MNEEIKRLKELDKAFKECFASKAGKKVIEYLTESYHIKETTWRSDINAIAYSEGQRTVVLDIIERIERKPENEGDEDNG